MVEPTTGTGWGMLATSGMEGTTADDDDVVDAAAADKTWVAFAGAINGTVTLEGICPAAEK